MWRHALRSQPPPLRLISSPLLRRPLSTSRPLLSSAPTTQHPQTFSPWRWTKLALTAALAGHIFSSYLYSFDTTWGISMLPHIAADGDVVVVSKYYRHGRDVQVGDLVSFRHPIDAESQALKRVMGLEGDFVLRDSPHRGRGEMIQVPAGHCYVVGDNLDHSRDSRMWGPLPMALIKGKAICKINRDRYFFPWPQAIGNGLQDPVEEDYEDD
ncbi:LexA/Signal peptidase [Myriangium duriaei CBS 260.36]|uniref:LexA/Signal peptidase n=1 Tax=Myriangium duriaei CBS 260.36 TaxID=1168546 RepID=A0A9P4J1X7_9PEZI|nr:LexA/Signal peptidase [Myriangium duriaei CBS 260.36]